MNAELFDVRRKSLFRGDWVSRSDTLPQEWSPPLGRCRSVAQRAAAGNRPARMPPFLA